MPIPAALLAAAPLIGGVISGATQGSMNRKNRKFQEHTNIDNRNFQREMTDKTRAWSIEDRDFNNAYNSPEQQMKRYEEAGLNKHLIYGNGTAAQSEAPKAQGSDAPNQQAPHIDNNFMVPIIEGLMNVIKTDNLRAQTELYEKQRDLAASNIDLNKIRGNKEAWDIERSRSLFDLDKQTLETAIENKKVNTLKQTVDTQFTLDANQRAELKNSADIKKTLQEIVESKMRIVTMKIQNAKTEEETKNLKETWKILVAQKDQLLEQTSLTKAQVDAIRDALRKSENIDLSSLLNLLKL